jgi:hypothetical protein
MKPLFTLLACLLPLTASAQDKDAPKPFYLLPQRAGFAPEAVTRASLTLPTDTATDVFGLCMVPPAADWALDAKDPALEEKYLHLAIFAAHLDKTRASRGQALWNLPYCADITRPQRAGQWPTLQSLYDENCKFPTPAKSGVGSRYAYTSSADKSGVAHRDGPGIVKVITESLKELLQSDHEATVLLALQAAQEYGPAENAAGSSTPSPFAPAAANLVRDPKTPLKTRLAAFKALAALDQSALTAKTFAAIWQDEKNSEDLRIAALKAFAFVVEYHDDALHAKDGEPKHAKTFKPELKRLMGIAAAEFQDFQDQAKKPANATNTKLGAAAYCAGESFPKSARDEIRAGK